MVQRRRHGRSRAPKSNHFSHPKSYKVVCAGCGKEATIPVLPPADMAVEGPKLAGQAAIRVLATPRARPARETMERAGMMLISAAPVRDDAGNIIGALCAGVLLNNNNTLVDRIKSIVYEGVQADGKDVEPAFALAFAMAVSAINVFFRDIGNVVRHFMRLWFYLSPGLYAFATLQSATANLPVPLFRHILLWNPFAILFTAYRDVIYGTAKEFGFDFLGAHGDATGSLADQNFYRCVFAHDLNVPY